MVRAYHVVIGTYGFWLPNDPRGSWSKFVGAWELFLAGGPATTTQSRESVASAPHDHHQRRQSKRVLKYPEVRLTGIQAKTIATSFGATADRFGCSVFALSILPQHIHMVVSRNDRKIESVVREFKQEASEALSTSDCHPLADFREDHEKNPTVWSRGCWKSFLSKLEEIERAIQYVEANPGKEGKPRQSWRFVKPVSLDNI